MPRRLILVCLALATVESANAQPSPGTAVPGVSKPRDPAQVRDDITASEQQIARQFADFEQALLKLTQRLKRSDKREDQERAKVLEKVLEESRSASITVQFERMVNALQSQKLNNPGEIKNLSDQSQKLADDLRKLLALMREDPRAKQVQEDRKKLEQLLKDLERIIHKQKGVQAQTDLGKTDPKELQANQNKISEQTARLAKDLGRFNDKDDKGGEAKNLKGAPKDAGKEQGKGGESKDAGKDADPKRGEAKDAGKGEPKVAAKGAEGKEGEASKKAGAGEPKNQAKNSKGPGDAQAKESKSPKGAESNSKESPKSASEKPASKGADPQSQAKAGPKSESKEGAKSSKGSESAKGEPKSSGEPNKGEAKSGQESKGQSQAKSQSQQQQQQQQQQQAAQKGDKQEGNQGQQQQKQEAQDDVAQAKKRVEDGNYHQRRAEDELKKKDNQQASNKQNDAIKELEKAKKELEKLLRQMREEELERLLAALQARCEKMLAMQMQVLAGTEATHKSILANADQKPKHENKQESLRLSDQEKEIVLEASKAIEMLEAEGSAVAFPEVFQQVREDMKHVQRRLEVTEVGSVTQTIERDIIETLKEMIEALKKARQELDSKQSKPSDSKSGPPPDQKLLDQIAELKMIRSLQIRVNTRTQVYGKQYEASEGEQTADPILRRELNNLAERQERIFEITNKIAKGDNR